MQPTVVVGARREAGPVLNVLLILVIVTSIIGAVCTGIGVKIGSSFSDVSSVGSSFWWGGVVLLILGALYIPCHVLVKMGNSSGRALFIFWTFLIGIGVIIILASTIITLVVWLVVNIYNTGYCLYYKDQDTTDPFTTPCKIQCNAGLNNKLGSSFQKVCCCCDDDYTGDYKIVYAKDVDSCSLFTDSFGLSRALLGLYIVGLILIFVDMVMAYVVACGCCDVQTPWFTAAPITTTTTYIQGSALDAPVVAPVAQPVNSGYQAANLPPKVGAYS